MGQCKCHEICGRDAMVDDDSCILHSQKGGKGNTAFDEALTNHRRNKGANFVSFVFPEPISFQEVFDNEPNFRSAKFSGPANFAGTVFRNGANFADAEFYKGVKFPSVEFIGKTTFYRAKFTEEANFTGARFTGVGNFIRAEFTCDADFPRVKFTEAARFTWAEFAKEADFSYAEFVKEAIFPSARFIGETNFFRTIFRARVNFHLAGFEDITFFVGEPLNDEEIKKGGQIFSRAKTVDFREVEIHPLDALRFRDADLRKCRFQGTDLRKAEFTDVVWAKRRGRLVVHDEVLAEKAPWSHVERLYRELKQNHEDRRDYERAGDFHYSEKEMRLKNPKSPLRLKIPLGLYWLVSGYGERCLRPLLWASGLLVTSTFCYLEWDLLNIKAPTFHLWMSTALYSLKVLTLLKPTNFEPSGLGGDVVNIVQSIAGPVLIGLFALALRQRLKR